MQSRTTPCIFGGTFNPVHWGHLFIAEYAFQAINDISKVFFIPVATPPHKQSVKIAPAKDRLEMIKLAIQDNPNFDHSDIEIRRAGISYTIDTILQFKKDNHAQRIYLLIGSDSWRDFNTWQKYDRIIEEAEIIVFMRSREDYLHSHQNNGKIHMLDNPLIGISSSEVRSRLEEDTGIRYYVHDTVIEYIERNKLYN